MATIMDLAQKSFEYHSALAEQGVVVGDACYFDNLTTIYMCAIGCNLQDPRKFQSVFAFGLDNIGLFKKELEPFFDDPIVKDLVCFPKFREEAAKLQILHDTVATKSLKKYLRDLEKLIELQCNFESLEKWREEGRLL